VFNFLSGSVFDKREELVLTLIALIIPMTSFPALI
jgi:hypothetical protein